MSEGVSRNASDFSVMLDEIDEGFSRLAKLESVARKYIRAMNDPDPDYSLQAKLLDQMAEALDLKADLPDCDTSGEEGTRA